MKMVLMDRKVACTNAHTHSFRYPHEQPQPEIGVAGVLLSFKHSSLYLEAFCIVNNEIILNTLLVYLQQIGKLLKVL